MGIDISHIIKHDFRKMHDRKAAMDYIEQTIDLFRKYFLLTNPIDDFDIFQDEESGETKFHLPYYEMDFYLHNGFWQIESYDHYIQLVLHEGAYFWLREEMFDIAKALDKDEIWYATEHYTWNGDGCAEPETTFEQWYESALQHYGKPIPEFDVAYIMQQDESFRAEPIYHDTFRECKILYDIIQSQLGPFRLMSLMRVGDGYLKCEEEGQMYLVNEQTQNVMFDAPIREVQKFTDKLIGITRLDGLTAICDADGNNLTDYVKGEFEWDWYPFNPEKETVMKRYICNKEANIRYGVIIE